MLLVGSLANADLVVKFVLAFWTLQSHCLTSLRNCERCYLAKLWIASLYSTLPTESNLPQVWPHLNVQKKKPPLPERTKTSGTT